MIKPKCPSKIDSEQTLPDHTREQHRIPEYLLTGAIKTWNNIEHTVQLLPPNVVLSIPWGRVWKSYSESFYHLKSYQKLDKHVRDFLDKCHSYLDQPMCKKAFRLQYEKRVKELEAKKLAEDLDQARKQSEQEAALLGAELTTRGVKEHRALVQSRPIESVAIEAVERAGNHNEDAGDQDTIPQQLIEELLEEDKEEQQEEEDEGEEPDEITQDMIHENLVKWMLNLIMHKITSPPQRPQDDGSVKRQLQLMSFELLQDFKDGNLVELGALRLSLSYIVCMFGDMADTFKEKLGDATWDYVKNMTPKVTVEIDDDIKQLVEEICEGVSAPNETLQIKVLQMYEYLINNVDEFFELDGRGRSSETDYLSAIMPILQILLRGETSLLRKTGETTAEATKHAQNHIRDGRKVDLLIAQTKDSSCDLSAFEWKKQNINTRQIILQQSKNIRSNKCNLARILGMNLLETDRQ